MLKCGQHTSTLFRALRKWDFLLGLPSGQLSQIPFYNAFNKVEGNYRIRLCTLVNLVSLKLELDFIVFQLSYMCRFYLLKSRSGTMTSCFMFPDEQVYRGLIKTFRKNQQKDHLQVIMHNIFCNTKDHFCNTFWFHHVS